MCFFYNFADFLEVLDERLTNPNKFIVWSSDLTSTNLLRTPLLSIIGISMIYKYTSDNNQTAIGPRPQPSCQY